MKKLFLAVLAASLFLLVSCGDNKKNDPKEEPENDTDQISDEEPSDSDAENDEEPVVKPDTDPVEPEPVEISEPTEEPTSVDALENIISDVSQTPEDESLS